MSKRENVGAAFSKLISILWEVVQRRWKAREYPTIGGGVGISAHVFHRGGRPIPTSTFDTQLAKACEGEEEGRSLRRDLP
jgi:hypothetical protein